MLSLFGNVFNKFNKKGAQMLDSIYHITAKINSKSHFWDETVKILDVNCNEHHFIYFHQNM